MIRHKIFLSLALLALLTTRMDGQTPSCDASVLILRNYQPLGSDAALVTLEVIPEPGVQVYQVLHEFLIGGEPMSELILVEDLLFPVELFPTSSPHTFTVISICEDGQQHTGSSFTILPGEDGEKCLPVTGLQVESLVYNSNLNRFIVDFSWDFNTNAPLYTVEYTAAGDFVDLRATTLNTHLDTLVAGALIHTFTIVAVCDTMVEDPRFALFSPPVQFSIITVDDIKVFRPVTCDICLDLCIQHSYEIVCSEHGNFGQNHEEFVTVHDSICEARLGLDWLAYRDSLCMNYDSACIQMLIDGVEVAEVFGKKPVVFPNPAGDEAVLSLHLKKGGNFTWRIADLAGRPVAPESGPVPLPAGEHSIPLPINALPPGQYWVVIRSGEGVFYPVPFGKFK